MTKDRNGKVQFSADSIKINGPLVDGSYSVSFKTGEYERKNIALLLALSQELLDVTVELHV